MELVGRVILFGDDVNTDVLHPSRFYSLDKLTVAAGVNEQLRTTAGQESSRSPDAKILVAGRNFGYGSSRETTLQALQANGVVAVIASSISRIFWRNCLNAGLWVFECPEPSSLDLIRQQTHLRMDVNTARVCSIDGVPLAHLPQLDDYELELLRAGGLMGWMAQTIGN